MSLAMITSLTSRKLLRSVHHHHHQQLLPTSIVPFAAPRRALKYRRPGTPPENKYPWEYINFNFAKGVEGIKRNFTLLKKEFFDILTIGPKGKSLQEHAFEQNRVVWEFRGPESLKQWVVSSDREIGGQSEAHLKLGRNGSTCLLHGRLNSSPPQDGETRYSGYCSLRSQPQLRAFNKKIFYDWTSFNSLHLRVRGDGRPWMVHIGTKMYYSLQKDDLYCYFLHTRGGPYWQDVIIPFSKFFLTYCGRIQDRQHPLRLDKVTNVGFSLGDQADGHFQLEIDFIGVSKDYAHTEEFAYEMYKNH
ncbi:complex I intermediate-associated protein 30, mitochondrial [Antennarius striatus]|uniref:complex I intermediate-associated protein 30, mitochondrial n=1 Tax=Antennarius striatus TaxID=241820 RepID=UPI0035ADB37F